MMPRLGRARGSRRLGPVRLDYIGQQAAPTQIARERATHDIAETAQIQSGRRTG